MIDKKIKVMHLINNYVLAGAEILAYNILERLDKEKFDIYICSIVFNNTENEIRIQKKLSNMNITVLSVYKPVQKNRFSTIFKLSKLLKKYKIDILHTHCSSPDFYGKSAAFFAKVPCVYSTVHDTEGHKKIKELLFRHLTTKYIAISATVMNYLKESIKIPDEKINLIYNGSIFPKIVSGIREEKLHELGIDSEKKVITSIGRLYVIKGHNYLIEAAVKIIKTYKNIHFLIVGNKELDISWTKKLLKMLDEYDLNDYFTLTGTREDVAEILLSSDIFILPSISEGLPLSLIEAMAAKLPVISSNVGSISEVIKDQQNGILIPPRSPEAIVKSISDLLEDNEFSKKIALNAYKDSRENFSISKTAKNYEKLYLDAEISNNY